MIWVEVLTIASELHFTVHASCESHVQLRSVAFSDTNMFSVPTFKTLARCIQHSMHILLALALPLAVRRTAARPCMCHVVACMLGRTPHSWRIRLALARLVPVRTTAAFATAQANGGQVASCNGPSRNPQSTRARTNARQVACWEAQGPQKQSPRTGHQAVSKPGEKHE